MKRFSLVLTALIAAACAGVAAFLLLPRDEEIPSSPGPSGKASHDLAPPQGNLPPLPDLPPGTLRPGGRLSTGSAGLALHTLLGGLPVERPAAQSAPGLPRGLDPAELEKIRDENVKTVIEMEKERRKREIEMFEKILGPLEADQASRFLEVYYRYHDDAWRDYRERLAEGESPNRDEVYREARERAYEKLAGLLDPVQLDKFRKWWEEECR